MKKYVYKCLLTVITLLSISTYASTLYEEANQRGINETCSSYLSQLEESYNLNGLNITFAHPENPALYPSLHISSKKYNNGSSSFSATLIPDDEYCYVSTVIVTAINNQTCSEIVVVKTEADKNLQSSIYDDGGYTILTPSNNDYQIILTSVGDKSCTMTETRMVWPGK